MIQGVILFFSLFILLVVFLRIREIFKEKQTKEKEKGEPIIETAEIAEVAEETEPTAPAKKSTLWDYSKTIFAGCMIVAGVIILWLVYLGTWS